jgi:nucleotide-binding universal stress UspA family protein
LVSEDPNTESLINYVVNKYSIDLALVGMKNSDQGAGIVGSKLMRLLKADLIFIPKNPPLKLEHILIGSDFSKNSKKSFTAMESCKDWFNSKITGVHVFHVPFQFAVHVPKEKLIPKIEQQACERADKFSKKLPENLVENIEILFAKEMSIAQKLVAHLKKTGADMLVLSDRGANNYSTLLIGSLTEEIFDEELKVPFYVVK